MNEKDPMKVKGAMARADALTAVERHRIARKAAAARWGNLPQATHRGNFKEEFGFDVDCYVLDDEQKTAVISQRGMGAAMGLSTRGNAFPRFASGKAIAPYLGADLQEKIANPLKFQGRTSGAQVVDIVHGYDVTLLIDVCKAILEADSAGRLSANQIALGRQARIILNASAKSGIRGLVYALAGYDASRDEIITAFKLYVRNEAREYEKEFPDQLYEQWYRLYQPPKPERGKPWKFKQLTVNQVYMPLANSNGRIHELTVTNRAGSASPWKKLHQFLSEIGVKALRTHLGQLLGIAQVSANREEYERNVQKIFGIQQMLEFPEPDKQSATV